MQISAFKGLNNVSEPLRLGLGWLAKADNVHVTDTGALTKREGYGAPVTGAYTGAFSTFDYQRLYLVDGGVLRTYGGQILKTGITAQPMYWAEINDQVFYNNGESRGIINPDNSVIDWAWTVPASPILAVVTGSLAAGQYQVVGTYTLPDGRQTGSSDPVAITLTSGQALNISSIPQAGGITNVYIAPAGSSVYQLAVSTTATAAVWNSSPDALGVDLLDFAEDPLPQGATIIAAWKGRMYAAQYFPADNQTAIWFSKPLGFHLFNLAADFILVPGQVHMLTATDVALVVGTGTRIYAYDGASLAQLADYGVTPGWHDVRDDGKTYFWSTRGLCAAMPFKNLTEGYVSVAPGVQAGGTIVQQGGRKRYLVALRQGGSAFNSYV